MVFIYFQALFLGLWSEDCVFWNPTSGYNVVHRMNVYKAVKAMLRFVGEIIIHWKQVYFH